MEPLDNQSAEIGPQGVFSMMPMVPLPYRVCAAVAACLALLAGAYVTGRQHGADSLQAKWSVERAAIAQAVAKQAIHIAAVAEAQSTATQESDRDTQTRIAAVHRLYADRVRKPASDRAGTLPAAAEAAGDSAPGTADAGPVAGGLRAESWGQLAERCAVTTVIAQGWQEWWINVEKAQVIP